MRYKTFNIAKNPKNYETLFYPVTVSVNKCGGSCNTIKGKKIKNMNLKAFNLMSKANETRFLVQHESCECKYRLNESVCNSNEKWNNNEFRCECKELDV